MVACFANCRGSDIVAVVLAADGCRTCPSNMVPPIEGDCQRKCRSSRQAAFQTARRCAILMAFRARNGIFSHVAFGRRVICRHLGRGSCCLCCWLGDLCKECRSILKYGFHSSAQRTRLRRRELLRFWLSFQDHGLSSQFEQRRPRAQLVNQFATSLRGMPEEEVTTSTSTIVTHSLPEHSKTAATSQTSQSRAGTGAQHQSLLSHWRGLRKSTVAAKSATKDAICITVRNHKPGRSAQQRGQLICH